MDTRDVKNKNSHSSETDITTQARDYSGEPLLSTKTRSYFHKFHFMSVALMFRGGADFSGLGGICDGP